MPVHEVASATNYIGPYDDGTMSVKCTCGVMITTRNLQMLLEEWGKHYASNVGGATT